MKEKIKKLYDKDLTLYLNFQTELKEYLIQYKKINYHKSNFKILYSQKKNELELILERLRFTLNIISITSFVDLE